MKRLLGIAVAALSIVPTGHHHHRHHKPKPPPSVYPTMGIHDGSVNLCAFNWRIIHKTMTPAYARVGDTMNDPAFPALRSALVRYSPTWDVAMPHDLSTPEGRALERQQLCLDAWLSVAAARGQSVELSLKPNTFHRDISLTAYRRAMQALISTYTTCNPCMTHTAPVGWASPPAGRMARVTVWASWGEPNFGIAPEYLPSGATLSNPRCPSSPTVDNCGPYLAAAMWSVVHGLCPSCLNLAGDYSSNGGYNSNGGPKTYMVAEADAFKRFRLHPLVWAMHPYIDIHDFEWRAQHGQRPAPLNSSLTARWLRSLWRQGYGANTRVWLDEISAFQISMFRHIHFSPALQAAGLRYLISRLPQAGWKGMPHVTAEVYLDFKRGNEFPYWSLQIGGVLQPAYYAFAHRPTRPTPRHHRRHRRHHHK